MAPDQFTGLGIQTIDHLHIQMFGHGFGQGNVAAWYPARGFLEGFLQVLDGEPFLGLEGGQLGVHILDDRLKVIAFLHLIQLARPMKHDRFAVANRWCGIASADAFGK